MGNDRDRRYRQQLDGLIHDKRIHGVCHEPYAQMYDNAQSDEKRAQKVRELEEKADGQDEADH